MTCSFVGLLVLEYAFCLLFVALAAFGSVL